MEQQAHLIFLSRSRSSRSFESSALDVSCANRPSRKSFCLRNRKTDLRSSPAQHDRRSFQPSARTPPPLLPDINSMTHKAQQSQRQLRLSQLRDKSDDCAGSISVHSCIAPVSFRQRTTAETCNASLCWSAALQAASRRQQRLFWHSYVQILLAKLNSCIGFLI